LFEVVDMTDRGAITNGSVVVTAAEMVAGHVSLDISCVDRLYLTGCDPQL
jgi:hypothetical protein